jgi:dihydrofolate reductase
MIKNLREPGGEGGSVRKVIYFNAVSVDGLFAGPEGEIDWHHVNEETSALAMDNAQGGGELVFGRKTYELMAGFWPTEEARAMDPGVAGAMNALPKHVFSRTLENAAWENTTLHREDPAKGLARLKAQPGDDLVILGSANLASALHGPGLIDEYHLLVNPLLLGQGRPLFEGLAGRVPLRLCDSWVFLNGVVLLRYERG